MTICIGDSPDLPSPANCIILFPGNRETSVGEILPDDC